MAELLAQWLNEEVVLSSKVTDFETDFANGYLFGELLYKYNQQQNFAEFSRKDVVAHKMGNFERLEPTLRNLKIQFNSQFVDKIMKRERGVALRLLYQLKMMLEKVYTPTDVQVLKATGQFADGQPIQKIPAAKEKYDGVQHAFFKNRLETLNKPQKTLNMEKHLDKFNVERKNQEDKASKEESKEKKQRQESLQDQRHVQINKLQRNADFMEKWHVKGVDNWKKNMTIKREREATQLEFDFKQAEKYNQVALEKLDSANREVNDGIEAFEQTLLSQGINTKVNKDTAHSAINETLRSMQQESPMRTKASEMAMTLTRMDPTKTTKNGAFTLASTGLKHKTKTTVDDRTRKAREKRRVRLVTQQYNIMENLDQQQREARVLDITQRKSNQEKELDYEVWRTNQCKNLIVENRKLREKQYDRRRQLDVQNGIIKEETLLVSLQSSTHRSVDEMCVRDGQLRNFETEARTKGRTTLCDQLMNAIFDIADEAYNHKQQLDSTNNDDRNWREWLQLFKQDMPIAGTHNTLSTSVTQETGGASLEEAEANYDAANQKLDEHELIDYLKNQGQWPVELVSSNRDLIEQLMNAPIEDTKNVKGAKGGKAAANVADTTLDKEDLELDETCQNNTILGDALEQIIKLNYEARSKLRHPQTPNWVGLKLCLVGYPFAGKKSSSEFIREKFGLDVFHMEHLIDEAREAACQPEEACIPEKVEDSLERSSHHLSEDEDLSEDEEAIIDAKKDFRNIGLEIEELLFSGEEISDEIYVRLFVTKLRITYEYKSPKTKLREMKSEATTVVEINERLAEIESKLSTETIGQLKKKQIKNFEAERIELQNALNKLQNKKTNGWVLVDFPCTYAQSKLLEQALSGHQPEIEQEPIGRDVELKDAHSFVQPSQAEAVDKDLIASGLDAVLWFDCPIQECLRRADGRYYDKDATDEDFMMFHVEDVQPPIDQAPLCERLQQQIRDNNAVSTLMDRFIAFDQQKRSMQRWIADFGVEEKNRNLLQEIDGNQHQEHVQAQIENIIQTIQLHKGDKEREKRDILEFKIKNIMEQQRRAAEEERLRLEAGEDGMSQRSSVVSPRVDESAANAGKVSQPDMSVAGSQPLNKSQQQVVAGQKSNGSILKEGSISIMGGGNSQQGISVQSRDNVDEDFRPIILKLWQNLSKNYKSQMNKALKNVRLHREQAQIKIANVQSHFLEFLHRLDNKQEILQDFAKNFNDFSNEYPDLREDDQTKEELHQRTDVLSDELWEIVEERKEQNIDERKRVMESGAVEFSQNFLTTCAKQFMQAELDKFKVSVQIIWDYYHAIEDKLIPEAAQANISELAFLDSEEPPAIEILIEGQDASNIDGYAFPRLDKLLVMALKQQAIPDVTQLSANIDPKKGGAKKDVKKGGTKELEEGASIEESQYVKEMKDAIKTEKAILRFRLVQIRNWALKNLKQSRQQAIDLYKKLDDWIYVAQKAEMDAIEEMSIVIKDSIESEAKVQDELRIQFMDFTVDKSVRNFDTPIPPKLEAMEDRREYRFSIPQLNSMYTELCRIEKNHMCDKSWPNARHFPNAALSQVLMNKINYSKNFGGYINALPESWKSINMQIIQGMMRNIDTDNTGYVDWRQFFTYLLLGQSTLPTVNQLEDLRRKMGNTNFATEEQFVNCKMWFDQCEESQDRHYSEHFDRVTMLKKILFNTNAVDSPNGKGVMMESLVESLRIPAARQKNAKRFSDFLLAPVKPIQH